MLGTDPAAARLTSGSLGFHSILAANRLVLLAAVPLFLVLAVVAYIAIQFAANERDAQSLVRHTFEVEQQLQLILSDAHDAETGQRGYLLTHREDP